MLDDQQILREIHALPPEKQEAVLNYIAFVKARTSPAQPPENLTEKNFTIRPAPKPSGYQTTVQDHDTIFSEAVQDSIS